MSVSYPDSGAAGRAATGIPLAVVIDQPLVDPERTPTGEIVSGQNEAPGGATKMAADRVKVAILEGRPVMILSVAKTEVQKEIARRQAAEIAQGGRPTPFVHTFPDVGPADCYFIVPPNYKLGREEAFNRTRWMFYCELLGVAYDIPFNAQASAAEKETNRVAARMLAAVAPDSTEVIVDDHQFAYVGSYLGPQRPDLLLGFFGHTHFPGLEYLKSLPESVYPRADLVELLLAYVAYDGVVLQTPVHSENLRDALKWLVEEGHLTRERLAQVALGSALVNIDKKYVGGAFRKSDESLQDDVEAAVDDLAPWIDGRECNVAAGRIDPYKNYGLYLEAVEHMYVTEQWKPDTHCCLIVAKSTRESPEYTQHDEDIDTKIDQINSMTQKMAGRDVIQRVQGTYANVLAAYYLATLAVLTLAINDGCNTMGPEAAWVNPNNVPQIMNDANGIYTRFGPLLPDEGWNPLVIALHLHKVATRLIGDGGNKYFDADPRDVLAVVAALLAAAEMSEADRARMAATHRNAVRFDSPERHFAMLLTVLRAGAAARFKAVEQAQHKAGTKGPGPVPPMGRQIPAVELSRPDRASPRQAHL